MIELHTPAQAFVGVGLIVLAADGQLTHEEAASVFDSLMRRDIFEGNAGFAARRFLADLLALGLSSMSASGGMAPPSDDETLAFSEDLIADVLAGAREILSQELRKKALAWAVDLALADGLDPSEQAMLQRIARGLELDEQLVARAIAAAQDKQA